MTGARGRGSVLGPERWVFWRWESGGAATGQCALESELVGVLESAARGEAVGDAGEGNSKWGDDFGQVVRRRLSFHIGAECEDYLGRAVFFDSAEKRFDAELVGTDVVEWREASAQGMVKAAENSAAFERENVGRLLHDAQFLALSRRLGADATQFLLGEKTALAARMDR